MILLTIAGYGLFCLAYAARPGRRAAGWLLAASILLPFALLGAAYVDGIREVNRKCADIRESTVKSLRANGR